MIPELVRIGCVAHLRRKFYRAVLDQDRRAVIFIAQLRQLYRIEQETRDLTPAHRHEVRQQRAPQIWNQIKERAQALQPQSSLGKAVSYLLNEYEALSGYLKDGAYLIDNNLTYADHRIMPRGVWDLQVS